MVVLNIFLKMKLKIVIYLGILGICLMIFSALIEFINYCVGNSTRILDNSDDIWKSASYQIEQDLSKVKIHGHLETSELKFKLPILIWWTKFSSRHGIHKCQDNNNKEYQCYFTHNRDFKSHPMTRGIFFYGTDFSVLDLPLPRYENEDWALIHEESPKNNPLISQQSVINLFNHTATFRTESDLPLTFQYLENLDVIIDETFLVPLAEKNQLLQKENLGLVAYVQSSCDTPSGRDEYVEELMNYIKVDSYGFCLHNKDLPSHLSQPQKMKDIEFLHILAKYKFVLAIENAVCDDYITEKLWKVIQIGSIPVYYGAPNVAEWLPNEYSAVQINEFSSPKKLAEHLHYLHNNDEDYLAHLFHKPSINQNALTLISNENLVRLMAQRSWGVSDQAQLDKGNFVQVFECLVCSRVARNSEMMALGFGKMPFDANEYHYGCPSPNVESKGTLSKSRNRWWERHWNQAYYESEVFQEFISRKIFNYTRTEFYARVLEFIREDNLKLLNAT